MTTPSMEYQTSNYPSAYTKSGKEVKRVPWSLIGDDFVKSWGRPRGKNQPEHLEILGATGSGKSFFLTQVLAEMARRRGSSIVFIATKKQDDTVTAMGWPIVDNWTDVQKHEQCVYWPKTNRLGKFRDQHQAEHIQDLLDNLWTEDANTIVVFDEFLHIQKLSPDLNHTLGTYLREGRAQGLMCVMGKQRAQEANREMHAQSDWKVGFKLNDEADNERMAELFGRKAEWIPVIEDLNREKYEFLIQHKMTGTTYISWIDKPKRLRPPVEKKNMF